MLTPEIVYTDDAVVLRIAQESFAGLQGLTHNQRQIAGAIDGAAGNSQLTALFDYLNYTDRSNVPALLSLLSPEELTAIFQIGVATAQIQNVNIENRLAEIRSGSHGFSTSGLALRNPAGSVSLDGVAMADGKKGLTIAGWDGKSVVSREVVAPVHQPSRFGFFATGHGEWANLSGTSEAPGQNFTSAGVTVGLDYRVSEHFVVGINGGYTNTQSDLERDGSLDVNGGRGGLYASYFNSGAYVNVAAGGGYNSYDMKRDTLGGVAKGSTDGADTVFTVNGPKIGRDSLLIDAGASVEFNQAVSVFAYYTGELGRTNYQSHAVNGGFRIAF